MQTKGEVLLKHWKSIQTLMRANCQATASLETLLCKTPEQLCGFMMAMGTGDHAGDARRASAYLAIMYGLDEPVTAALEAHFASCLQLCGSSSQLE